jgi:hypothetical protein
MRRRRGIGHALGRLEGMKDRLVLLIVAVALSGFSVGCRQVVGLDSSTPRPTPTHHCAMDVVGATPHPSC